jgi:hypothetical protein
MRLADGACASSFSAIFAALPIFPATNSKASMTRAGPRIMTSRKRKAGGWQCRRLQIKG